ncbi:hypothetical protein DFP73DRAFT_562263 [Morchella snyderi]|nr:hypothetical protein DFP73DRAFT_562263 [Morchella snyderi]
MATIKPIEQKSVHHIQSGQVIGDGLASVVKELVENSFDASATSIEIRFKNYGLDSVEVVDNGVGITSDNYESIALKHWTSKLTSYDDLDNVTTFGFRGEALSSLCALADLHITTATAEDAPKGTRLEFETSGKLKSRSVAAAQRGTTVLVENIFKTLPVRRSELERNIKREYTKVLGILQAYAGIYVGVKFSVFNQPPRGRKTPVFATKGNPTTRENIANVFGAKTLTALVALDLQFEMTCTRKGIGMTRIGGGLESKEVKIVGHISRPTVGEGRQTPDRQMFFINGRPCVLPQISKAFNEVYRNFNVTQSPFIFADIHMDTNAYDVNVSPDKRSILLHDQAKLLESLKASLMEMFTNHEQTVPHTQLGIKAKVLNYKQNSLNLPDPPINSADSPSPDGSKADDLIMTENHADIALGTTEPNEQIIPHSQINEVSISDEKFQLPKYAIDLPPKLRESNFKPLTVQDREKVLERPEGSFNFTTTADEISDDALIEEAEEFEARLPSLLTAPNIRSHSYLPTTMTSPLSKLSYYARGSRANNATITIGDRDPIITGNSPPSSPSKRRKVVAPETGRSKIVKLGRLGQPKFSSGILSRFAAPTAQKQFREKERRGGADDFGPESLKGHEDIGGEMGIQEPDEMVLDENQYLDRDPDEPSTDSSDLGETVVVPDLIGSNQSFIPNVEFSAISGDEIMDDERDSSIENGEGVEPDENPEDDDFMDGYGFLKQSSIRAQKLFEQAEDSVAKPTSKNLERAFEILEGSPDYTTKRVFRTCSTSVAQLKKQLGSLGKFSTGITAKNTSPSNYTLTEDDLSAEEHLNLTISKKDFFEMQIKGQFNKGFILTTRGDDLFIIDQHASDEKYNFETLQQNTVVQNQRLVVPKVLELMAMDEVIVTEHLDLFKKNGFIIEVDPEAPTSTRCRLISLPLSKDTVFGIKDLEELIHLVHEDQGNSSVRCSKVRSMFAMRACKKSTKVGRALTIKGMERIVRHMGELDKPWNCPHGRPTMRHLVELGQITSWNEYSSESVNSKGLQWGSQNWADTWREFNIGEFEWN